MGKHQPLSLDTHKYKTTFTSTTKIVLRFSNDTVEGVETNGYVLANNKPTTADTFLVFFGVVNANLPTIACVRWGLLLFAMVVMNDEVLFIQPER